MQSPKSMYPPLPPQPQAHFYGAPDIDFGIPRTRSQSRPPTNGFCSMFDTLALAGDEGIRASEDVLLVGSETSLNVYSISKNNPNCIGRLSGLRGSVLAAKVLPCHSRLDSLRRYRPLVAVVVHGP